MAWRRAAPIAALATIVFASAASAEPWGAPQPIDLHLGRLVAALLISIALAVTAAVLLKRRAKAGAGKGLFATLRLPGVGTQGITVLESRRISIHADACRFACGGREYLVVVSPGGATVLRDEAAPSEPAP